MSFQSPFFLFIFLPLACLAWFIPAKKMRIAYLAFWSCIFYLSHSTTHFYLFLVIIFANYSCALWLTKINPLRVRARQLFLLAVISFNIMILILFRYGSWFLSIGKKNGFIGQGTVQFSMPLGLSFIVFMLITYLIDVYRNVIKAEKNIAYFAFFNIFFAKIVSGPIEHYLPFRQSYDSYSLTSNDIYIGIRRFIIGFAKKIFIADTLAKTTSAVFATPGNEMTCGIAWIGMISFSLQILFDFGGYTDMAIGLGRMFGFQLSENFIFPYAARSLKDFWSRWHITLTKFLRDYVFLPLAFYFSRHIKKMTLLQIRTETWLYCIATLSTMTVCGLWHGTNVNFIVWGALHGLFLIIERFFLSNIPRRFRVPINRMFMISVVGTGWVIFRSTNLSYAVIMLKSLLGFNPGNGVQYHGYLYLTHEWLAVTIIALGLSFPWLNWLRTKAQKWLIAQSDRLQGFAVLFVTWTSILLWLGIFFWCLCINSASTYQPFLYAQF